MSRDRRASEFNKARPIEMFFQLIGRVASRVIRAPLDLRAVRRILVLQLQQLGDSVVFTPTLRSVRTRFPDAEIHLLCSPTSFQFYHKCPHAHRLWLADWIVKPLSHPVSAWRQIRALREQRFDLVISDVTHISARYTVISWLSGGRNRIGFDVDRRGFLLTAPLRRPDELDFLRCNLEIAKQLGGDATDASTEAYFDEQDERDADELLRSTSGGQHVIAIHAASNWQSKTWFPERWSALADGFVRQLGATVVFLGAEKERAYIDPIVAATETGVWSLAGKTTLKSLAALLGKVDLFVGTDSGPRHVAAGAGCRRVTLMSAQDRSERWQFSDPNEIVLRTEPPCSPCFQSYCSHRECMAGITELAVVDAARALLGMPSPLAERRPRTIHAHSA